MKKSVFTAAAVFISVATFSLAQADDVTNLLDSAQKNYADQNYSKAIEDLEWAKKGIVNQQLGSMKKLFPAKVDGMQGVDMEEGAVLGVRGTSRKYSSVDGGKSVVVSFVSGEGTAAGNGLGALMKMAASLGALESGKAPKLVISKGYKGQYVAEGADAGTLTFNLSGGKMVTIATAGYQGEQGAAMAEKVAGMLDLATIEKTF